MNILVRNPEIVFVADLTRADAPALVMTTQCEVVMKSSAEGSQMTTAVIKDLKVCVFCLVGGGGLLLLFLICLLCFVFLAGGGLSLPGGEEEK